MEARDELKHSLRIRKEIAIEKNDTHYQEEDTTELFANGNSSDFYATITNLIEKKDALIEEVKNIKIEQEVQSVLLCEVAEHKTKDEEDKVMIEDEKMILTN